MNSDLWYQLPPDMQMWNTAVLENISRKIPEITSYITSVTWSKLDPATGDGDGLVEFLGGIGAAPIIIRGNKLAPIDLITTNTNGNIKFYPLSPLFLQKIYADNVIGTPVQNQTASDDDHEGPTRRIRNIKTVEGVKYASVEAAEALLGEITKSASVTNWMLEQMPETFLAICERVAEGENEKTASAVDDLDLPPLMMVWRDNDKYYANGNEVNADIVSDFCKMASATDDERIALMNGIPLVRDFRTKVAEIHIPEEQDLIADAELEDVEDLFTDSEYNPAYDPANKNDHQVYLATAYMKDGTKIRGLIFDTKNWCPCHIDSCHNAGSIPTTSGPQEANVHIGSHSNHPLELFISEKGYGINASIKTTSKIGTSVRYIYESSVRSDPTMGAMGLVLYPDCLGDFGRIESVIKLPSKTIIKLYSHLDHAVHSYNLDNETGFFETVNHPLDLAFEHETTATVSMTGVNGIVTRNNEGDFIIDGITYSSVNCPYALMSKYAASYDDAVKIATIASKFGKCIFEVTDSVDTEKTAAEAYNDNLVKRDNKGTKAGTDDTLTEAEVSNYKRPSLAAASPESTMSLAEEDMFDTGNTTESNVPAAGQINNGPSGYTMPVSSKDLENVIHLNNPTVVDAYMMSNLSSDLTSKENLMRTSDSILHALEDLSQLLFLVRQGNMDYLNENDVQVAMMKLTEVAQSLGINTSQVGA